MLVIPVLLEIWFYFSYMFVCVCVYVCLCAHERRYLQRPTDALELKFQAVVSCRPLCVLGTERWSFSNELNHGSIFLALSVVCLKVFHNVTLISFENLPPPKACAHPKDSMNLELINLIIY